MQMVPSTLLHKVVRQVFFAHPWHSYNSRIILSNFMFMLILLQVVPKQIHMRIITRMKGSSSEIAHTHTSIASHCGLVVKLWVPWEKSGTAAFSPSFLPSSCGWVVLKALGNSKNYLSYSYAEFSSISELSILLSTVQEFNLDGACGLTCCSTSNNWSVIL